MEGVERSDTLVGAEAGLKTFREFRSDVKIVD